MGDELEVRLPAGFSLVAGMVPASGNAPAATRIWSTLRCRTGY